MRNKPRALARILSLLVVPLATAIAPAADPPAERAPAAVLHLTTGSYAAGDLDDSANPAVIRWHAAPFVSSFEFATDTVNAIHWPAPARLPRPEGDYCFELAGGDVLFGSLLDLDDRDLEMDVPRLGRLKVERANVHRIHRWRESADLIYLGPNGLAGWTDAAREPQKEKGWFEESGQLVTDKEGVSLRGDFGIPDKAAIEFEISWKTRPDFILGFGVNENPASIKRAFRLECWSGEFVVEREVESEADIAVVHEIPSGAGRTHLQVFLDQRGGRLLVFSQSGKRLAELKLNTPKPAVLPGLYLANLRGDLRLEWLRISRWSGELPREVNADLSRVHRADGSIAYGQVKKFDAASREFVFTDRAREARIPENKITSIFLSVPGEEMLRNIRAVYHDGSRLSGDLVKVENAAVFLTVPGFRDSLRLPVAGLRSLLFLRHEGKPPAQAESTGRLEMEGLLLSGHLVDGRRQPGASCLVWHPNGSATASATRPGAAGRIIYKEAPPPPQQTRLDPQVVMMQRMRVQRQQQQRQGGNLGAMVMRFAEALNERPPADSTTERRSLYLRDGDVITSVITKIDEKGVWFRTSLSTSTFVPHGKVKAVELADQSTPLPVRLTRSKRERLLTLPRMQKPDPPTHLIRSTNGDIVRGRLIKMDDKTLQVEVRLEPKDVPRNRIAQIIWLHADELDPTRKPPSPAGADAPTRVQALRNDGIRLTFSAEQVSEGTISGNSDVLGPCRVAVAQTDQLMIGAAIDQAAARLTYQQWKLKNAPEPKFVQNSGTGGDAAGDGASGTESPLVGKPAPDFELELLGGKKFHLADSKGKVVVLDFWATWCGPCLQAMPQVERATREVENQGVQLVAVNLQETAQQVSSMLERHKLKLTVALDSEGLVAEKYKAVAIPQTVIINRDGTVARLFVGGGPRFENQLRAALKTVLAGAHAKPKETADKAKEPSQHDPAGRK